MVVVASVLQDALAEGSTWDECVTWPKVITSFLEEDKQGFEHRNRICFSSLGLKEGDCKRKGESNKPRGHACLFAEFLSLLSSLWK